MLLIIALEVVMALKEPFLSSGSNHEPAKLTTTTTLQDSMDLAKQI